MSGMERLILASKSPRRAELLAQLGYPEDYLSEKPRCPLCGDTGYRGDGL